MLVICSLAIFTTSKNLGASLRSLNASAILNATVRLFILTDSAVVQS
jgi:hypothetical protein